MEGGERMKMRMLGSKRRRTRGRTDVNGEMDTFTQSLAEVGPFFSLLSPLEQIREQSKPGHPMSNPPQPSGARLPALISVHSYGTYAFKHVFWLCPLCSHLNNGCLFPLLFFFFLSLLIYCFPIWPSPFVSFQLCIRAPALWSIYLSSPCLSILLLHLLEYLPAVLSKQRQPYLYLHPQPQLHPVTRHKRQLQRQTLTHKLVL